MRKSENLKEIASVFAKLGVFAFGGPAAHIAMMEDEIIEKRKWMTQQEFLDLVGATNLIPGPNSTEMTMHCGYIRGGVAGLFTAGICFIFPAVLITGILAYLYIEYGQLPAIEPWIIGIKPAVLAIILGAIYKLGKKALKNWQLAIIGLIVIILNVMGLNEVFSILLGGLMGLLLKIGQPKKMVLFSPALLLGAFSKFTVGAGSANIFWIFLKVGGLLFGSGYVLLAYLDGMLIEELGWLSRAELLDAIAIGQLTPGPVLSTSTFIGYQLNGVQGAIAATIGIFLPSFLFVWLLNPLVPKLRSSPLAGGFLDGVNVAAVAIMVVVTFQLGQSVLVNWQSILIAGLSILVFFGLKKVSVIWIVIGGAVLGKVLTMA